MASCGHTSTEVFPGVTVLQAAFRTSTGSSRADGKRGLGGGKVLIWRRLERDGSPAVARPPGPGGPGPLRSEPSSRGSFRERVGFANLKCRPDKNSRLRGGIEKQTEGVTLVSMCHSAPQFPLHPYTGLQLAAHDVRVGAVVVDEVAARIGNVGQKTGDEVEGIDGVGLLAVVAGRWQVRGSGRAWRPPQAGEADGVAQAVASEGLEGAAVAGWDGHEVVDREAGVVPAPMKASPAASSSAGPTQAGSGCPCAPRVVPVLIFTGGSFSREGSLHTAILGHPKGAVLHPTFNTIRDILREGKERDMASGLKSTAGDVRERHSEGRGSGREHPNRC